MRRLPVLLLLVALGCAPGAADDGEDAALRIAAPEDGETRLLAHAAARLLEDAGLASEVVELADAADGRQALELGAVEVRIGYTGETWLEVLGRPDPPSEPRASVAAVSDHDREEDIVWLPPRYGQGREQPPANATFALAVLGPPAADADLRTVSQLATRLSERPEATVCVDEEFGSRPDGLRAVLEAYGVSSERPFLAADPEEAVLGVAAGDCLAGLTTATDGRAYRAGLQMLEDDLGVFPAFVPLPQVRAEALEADPAIRDALRPLAEELTTALLTRHNAAVVGGGDVAEVGGALATAVRERAEADRDEG